MESREKRSKSKRSTGSYEEGGGELVSSQAAKVVSFLTATDRQRPPGGRSAGARGTDTDLIDAQSFGSALARGHIASAAAGSAKRPLRFDRRGQRRSRTGREMCEDP